MRLSSNGVHLKGKPEISHLKNTPSRDKIKDTRFNIHIDHEEKSQKYLSHSPEDDPALQEEMKSARSTRHNSKR